jgi:hypothetical protein
MLPLQIGHRDLDGFTSNCILKVFESNANASFFEIAGIKTDTKPSLIACW